MPSDTSPRISVSVKVAAEMTGLSVWQIKQRCDAGLIVAHFDGQTRLVDHESLTTYIKSLPTRRPEGGAA